MAFNIGAGLARMGADMSKTLGAMTLEEQRAQLEEKKIKMADELATARDDKNRAHQSGEAEKQRTFAGGENKLDRESREMISRDSNRTSLAVAGINAGSAAATRAESARQFDAGLGLRQDENRRQNEELELRKAESGTKQEVIKTQLKAASLDTLLKEIETTNATRTQEANTKLLDAQKSGDQAAIKQALDDKNRSLYMATDPVKTATLYGAQTEQARKVLDDAQTNLSKLSANGGALTNKAAVEQATADVAKAQKKYNAAYDQSQRALEAVPSYKLFLEQQQPTGTPTAPSVLTYDAQGRRVDQAKPSITGAPRPPGGLLNNPASP